MSRWSSPAGLAVISLLALVVGFGGGMGIEYGVMQPPRSRAEAQAAQQQVQLTQLEGRVAAGDARLKELLASNGDVQEELAQSTARVKARVDDLREEQARTADLMGELDKIKQLQTEAAAEKARLEAQLAALSTVEGRVQTLEESLSPLESDRLLLVELRKNSPDTRNPATDYWKNVKKLAVRSDPSLGPKADRILRVLPTYFDWLETDHPDNCSFFDTYVSSGAVDFGNIATDFEKDVFLVIINRMDSVVTLAN